MSRFYHSARKKLLCLCVSVVALSCLSCLEALPEEVYFVFIAPSNANRVRVYEEITLKATVAGIGRYDYTVTWSSSAEAIARVDPVTGKVTGVAVGTVSITATSNGDSTARATVEIVVIKPRAVRIEIEGGESSIVVGLREEVQLTAVVRDLRGNVIDDPSLIWSLKEADTMGVHLDEEKGVIATDQNEVDLTVIVMSKTEQDVTGRIKVVVMELPALISLGLQHTGTEVGLLYNRDQALQRDLPRTDDILDAYIPANYRNLELGNCVVQFITTSGTTLLKEGEILESGVSEVDLSATVELHVRKRGLERVYSVSFLMSDYGIIPDDRFRAALQEVVGASFQGDFLETKDSGVTQLAELDCSRSDIKSLEGIEFFTGLTKLTCFSNDLNSLDLSQNTSLESLKCFSNNLTTLDVSNHPELSYLHCSHNGLTKLSVETNLNLNKLYVHSNNLKSLDVTRNVGLKTLFCWGNTLDSLDLGSNTQLESLYCFSNNLSKLDLSQNTSLEELDCSHNRLTELDISSMQIVKNNNLKTFDLTNTSNQITTLAASSALSIGDDLDSTITFFRLQGPTVSDNGAIHTYSR